MRANASPAPGGVHLFIVNDFPPISGGQSSYLYHLCLALPPEKIVVLAPACGETEAFDQAQPFRIIRRRYLFHIPVIGKVAKIVLPLLWVPGIIRREHVAVLHCAHVLSTGFIGLILKATCGIDYALYTHSADILEYRNNFFIRPWLKRILAGAPYVMANSRFTIEKLVELGVPESRIIHSRPRIDYAVFATESDSSAVRERYGLQGKRVLLSVNRLIERKGNDTVIRALPALLKLFPDLVYVICGSGPWRGKLRRLAQELHVKDAVIFINGNDAERKALLDACEVFVMVSRSILQRGDTEGFGTVYLEAGACGKPVVAGDSGGVRDAVVDGLNGLMVDPLDSSAVAGAVERLLSNPAFASEMGRRGKERVAAEFDCRKGASELALLFE